MKNNSIIINNFSSEIRQWHLLSFKWKIYFPFSELQAIWGRQYITSSIFVWTPPLLTPNSYLSLRLWRHLWTYLFQIVHGCSFHLNDCYTPDEVDESKVILSEVVQTGIFLLTNNKVYHNISAPVFNKGAVS